MQNNVIKISDICGFQPQLVLTDEFNYDFSPEIYQKLLAKSNSLLAKETEFNNRIDYKDHWHELVDGELTISRELTLEVLEEEYGAMNVQKIITYMRNKFKDQLWKPDNFFYYLEAALENNK